MNTAIRHMRLSWRDGLGTEAGGMFALPPLVAGRVVAPGRSDGVAGDLPRYLPGLNVSDLPSANIEFAAEWMAEMVHRGYVPLAFIHSHPGGTSEPSDVDQKHFPWWMVRTCFVYYGNNAVLTGYNGGSSWSARADELFAEKEA